VDSTSSPQEAITRSLQNVTLKAAKGATSMPQVKDIVNFLQLQKLVIKAKIASGFPQAIYGYRARRHK
jgi:hypothetical protein